MPYVSGRHPCACHQCSSQCGLLHIFGCTTDRQVCDMLAVQALVKRVGICMPKVKAAMTVEAVVDQRPAPHCPTPPVTHHKGISVAPDAVAACPTTAEQAPVVEVVVLVWLMGLLPGAAPGNSPGPSSSSCCSPPSHAGGPLRALREA